MRYTPSTNIKTVPAYDMSKEGEAAQRTFNMFEAKQLISEGWYCRRVNVCAQIASVKYGYIKH